MPLGPTKNWLTQKTRPNGLARAKRPLAVAIKGPKMLLKSVIWPAGHHYPAAKWLLTWFKWLLILLVMLAIIHCAFFPYSLIVSPIIYLLVGWRLNHVIYRNLTIDPYNMGNNVAAVLTVKTRMILGWVYRWPAFLARLWLAQVL